MAPKKKGPFFFFMRELQNERKERNQPCTLDAVRDEAGEKWKTLTEEQKSVYEGMANDFKERGRGALHNKLTSDGRTIASVLQEEDEKIQQRRQMMDNIHRYVDDIGTVDEIKRWPFYILSFNILCEANGVYYPLEVGLIEYSIEQGFIRAFHKFINPGPIPLGFASAAKDHSEATHGLPITGFEEGTTDYRSVVRDLMAYLRLPVDETNLPPLFCMQDHIPQAIGCLQWLEVHGSLVMDFPVWDILPLLRKLRSVVGEDISHAEAENILNSALFDYELKSLCPYHLDIDNKNCALGECRRLGYKMSNALLHAYRIERIIDYQHLPPRFDPSLNFEVSQMNVRPARMSTSRRHLGGSGDHGPYYQRSSHAPAPLSREARRVEDYYAEQRGPRVVPSLQPGPSNTGGACASVGSLVEQFPSLGESMLGRKPPGYFGYSSTTPSYSDLSDTASATSEYSVSSGAKPKAGAAPLRLAAQLVDRSSVVQGIGRGLPMPGTSGVQSLGSGSSIPIPGQAPAPQVYIRVRKGSSSDDPLGKGMGRGGTF